MPRNALLMVFALPIASIGAVLGGSGQFATAVLGIAFLIFIHEAGHFAAAKWCGVRVEVFSLGFGKRLWGFERGGTDYRLSLLPLGGYVQMLGQDDGDPSQARTEFEDDFRNKSVGQRALILSGGVIVNAIFAVLAFILAFWLGVPFPSPEIGWVSPTGAAHGLIQAGDKIIRMGGQDVIAFNDIPQIVALSAGQELDVELERRVNGETKLIAIKLKPQMAEGESRYSIGVAGLHVISAVVPGSETEKRGFRPADQILSFTNERGETQAFTSPDDIAELVLERAGASIKVQVFRPTLDELGNPSGAGQTLEMELPCPKRPFWSFGIDFDKTVRLSSVAAESAAARGGLLVDDLLLSLDGREVDTKTLVSVLQEVCQKASSESRKSIKAELRRGTEAKQVEIPLPEPKSADKSADTRFTLGIGYGNDLIGSIVPGGALAAAIAKINDPQAFRPQVGDRLLKIQSRKRLGVWWTGDSPGHEVDAREIAARMEDRPCRLTFARGGETHSLVLNPSPDPRQQVGSLELSFEIRKVQVQRGLTGALALGLYSTKVNIAQVLQMLRGLIVSRDVSVKELGGPIKIVTIATKLADHGLGKVLWFLALLSVNLAVLNVLPIPALDGGHLMFLSMEWLKGEPLSENVLIYAQWAGVFLILGLILTVTFNDLVSLLA